MRRGWILLIVVVWGAEPLFAEPVALTVSRVFTDRAVLQRDRPVPVWGTATPGTTVSVTYADVQRSAVSGPGGLWRVDLPAMPARSDGQDLVIETTDGQERTLSDVVVGDLWLCAGQSNMELGMAAIADRAAEMKDLKYPDLRLYLVSKTASGRVRPEVFGAWVPSDRVSVTSGGWNGFSAVAYTFGRRLQKELGVPVGVIEAAYGGSAIAAWIPPEDLTSDPRYAVEQAAQARADQAWASALANDPGARHPFDDPSDTKDLGPGSLWNAMVAPLGPLALRGVLWYQGETDVGSGPLYTAKMNTLIAAWRRGFGQTDLPFFFVQVAPWEGYGGDSLPQLWAAQEAVLATPGTGMAPTVDLGDFQNIHPANKKPVGERLALQALAKAYGRTEVVADGPVFAGWNPVDKGVLVTWSSHGALATRDGAAPAGFEVLDGRGTWSPAPASLVEGGVFLAAPGAQGVRYAWSPTPVVNLTDATGLPARPFQAGR